MEEKCRTSISNQNTKKKDTDKNIIIYKDAAIKAIQNVTDFDIKIIVSNDEYLDKLLKADSSEYEILKMNMEKAESETERQAIRDRIVEMKKERYGKDSENKNFYEIQQREHKNFNLQVLCSLVVATGLVIIYRKPIINMGKKYVNPPLENILSYSAKITQDIERSI